MLRRRPINLKRFYSVWGFWINLLLFGSIIASVIYLLARRMGVMALVDLIWTAGLGLSAIAYFATQVEVGVRAFVVFLVIVIWSGRLSSYLFTNRVLAGKEDPRYAYLTKHWGLRAPRNYYFLFVLQVVLVALFLLPVSVAMESSVSAWNLFDWLGLSIALIALIGEATADQQLARFRADVSNKGEVYSTGLWHYSRHPNYFFEWLHWWAYPAFAWGSSNWLMTLSGPVLMFLFLRYFTGIPHAERSSLLSRGEAYRNYQQTTNMFFPWKPRQSQASHSHSSQ
jgi:steroid 5-alpha reductase family enzyme